MVFTVHGMQHTEAPCLTDDVPGAVRGTEPHLDLLLGVPHVGRGHPKTQGGGLAAQPGSALQGCRWGSSKPHLGVSSVICASRTQYWGGVPSPLRA